MAKTRGRKRYISDSSQRLRSEPLKKETPVFTGRAKKFLERHDKIIEDLRRRYPDYAHKRDRFRDDPDRRSDRRVAQVRASSVARQSPQLPFPHFGGFQNVLFQKPVLQVPGVRTARKALVCAKREIRKEIMHALGHSGKGGQKSPLWSFKSYIKCKKGVNMWPAIIAGAAGLGGAALNFFGGKAQAQSDFEASREANAANLQATREANEASLALARRNEDLQREFAQNGIRWKVEDAARAGIHPLYALGGSTTGYSPSSVAFAAPDIRPASRGRGAGASASGATLANMGQDISRAIQATQTAEERAYTRAMNTLNLQKAALENDLLKSQINNLTQPPNPPIPSITGENKRVKVNPMQQTATIPGQPWTEAGPVPDIGYARTQTGYAPVPSNDVKQKIEDTFIPETMWALRTYGAANFGSLPPPPKSWLPSNATHWRWNHMKQEFQPVSIFDKSSKGYFLIDRYR